MYKIVRVIPLLTLALAACGGPPSPSGIAEAKHQYLAAKGQCDEAYSGNLSAQADCRTHAANIYIRPYYRYGDLMDYAQAERRYLAAKADRHEISRAEYDRELARSEHEVSREEDRRNRLTHTASSYQTTPLTPVIATIARLFQ